jgi:hypothetical protein
LYTSRKKQRKGKKERREKKDRDRT